MTQTLLHPTRRLKLFVEGQELFNKEKFFEAHEAWEFLWKQERGDNKTFLQGLIMAAGHFVHLEKGNWDSAHKMAEKAKSRLSVRPKSKEYLELDIGPVASALVYNIKILSELEYNQALRPAGKTKETPPPNPGSFITPRLLD